MRWAVHNVEILHQVINVRFISAASEGKLTC